MANKDETITADSFLSSYQVGALLQVNPRSVNKWVKEGRINAFRTPGGHRRIKASDVVTFLKAHDMPVPKSLEGATRARLLIVDDDPRQLAALQRALKPYSDRMEVQTVDNGIEALVQVGSYKPNLVLLDVVMNELDGLEVCRRLKAREETASIRVIMVTGQLTAEIQEQASAAGAAGCLEKPIKTEQLLEALEQRTA